MHIASRVAFCWGDERLYSIPIRGWQFGASARAIQLALAGGGVKRAFISLGGYARLAAGSFRIEKKSCRCSPARNIVACPSATRTYRMVSATKLPEMCFVLRATEWTSLAVTPLRPPRRVCAYRTAF
jgi:hypothetical protein